MAWVISSWIAKYIGQLSIVAVRPDMAAVLAVDELAGDANAGPGLADAALQKKLYPEFCRGLLGLQWACPCR